MRQTSLLGLDLLTKCRAVHLEQSLKAMCLGNFKAASLKKKTVYISE